MPLVITAVQPRSVAEHAGLFVGDRLATYDGAPLHSAEQLRGLSARAAGRAGIVIELQRAGELRIVRGAGGALGIDVEAAPAPVTAVPATAPAPAGGLLVGTLRLLGSIGVLGSLVLGLLALPIGPLAALGSAAQVLIPALLLLAVARIVDLLTAIRDALLRESAAARRNAPD